MIARLLIALTVLTALTAVLVHRYLLDTPLPDGIEDPAPLRSMVATYNFVFYTGAAAWLAGATRSFFEPVKLLVRAMRRGNAEVHISGVDSRMEFIAREDGSQLPMKIDTPQRQQPDAATGAPTPCVIYLHGGGYTLNNPAVYHAITANLSSSLQLPVFTPDYRKSPQWTHPAALEDALTALRHVRANAARYNIDAERVALMGDSAGAHLSIVSTLRMLDQKQQPPVALVLLYPATQLLTTCLPSHLENGHNIFLSKATASAFRLALLVGDTAHLRAWMASNHSTPALRSEYAQRFGLPLLATQCPWESSGDSPGLDWAIERYKFAYEDWLLSPLFAPQELLAQFPPSLMQTCQFDISRDEGQMFYERLKQSGVAGVEHRQYASVHGMASFLPAGHLPAIAAIDDGKAFLRKSLHLADEA